MPLTNGCPTPLIAQLMARVAATDFLPRFPFGRFKDISKSERKKIVSDLPFARWCASEPTHTKECKILNKRKKKWSKLQNVSG